MTSRRDFLKRVGTPLVGLSTHDLVRANENRRRFSLSLGVCASYEKAVLLKNLGYGYVEEGVGRFLIPDGGDAQYKKNVEIFQTTQFPIRSYVTFAPGTLKSVGPNANHEGLLERADLAFKRAKECNSPFVVFGSSASRTIPDGFDRQTAKQQHIEVATKMALLAQKQGITIALEPLNRGETNFINSLAEGAEIVEAVNHPNFKLLADIYHMLRENEGPEQIVKYGKMIVHTHIAEKQNRTAPGVAGDDFTAYFRALRKIKYKGAMSLECRWKDFDNEVKVAMEVLQKQFSEV